MGGGGLGLNFTWMCVSTSEGHRSFFWHQVTEMSEIISLKTCEHATSINMCEKLSQESYVIKCWNGISDHRHYGCISNLQNGYLFKPAT